MSSKEKRAQRAFRLQSPHNYVIEKVAEYFNLNPEVVKSGVLDYLEYIVLMDSLFAEKGRKAIMFYYQDGEQLTEKGKISLSCCMFLFFSRQRVIQNQNYPS